MPNPYSPYQEAGHAVDRLSGGLNNIIVGLAQQRYQQQQAARQAAEQERQFNLELQFKQAQLQRQGALDKQRGSLLDAQTQNALAMGGLNKQRENELANNTAARMNVGRQASIYSLANQPMMADEVTGEPPVNMEGTKALALQQMLESLPSVKGNQSQLMDALIKGFNVSNPEVSAAMATGTKLRQTLPLNTQLVDMLTGQTKNPGIINQGPGYQATDMGTGQVVAKAPFAPGGGGSAASALGSVYHQMQSLQSPLGGIVKGQEAEYERLRVLAQVLERAAVGNAQNHGPAPTGAATAPPMPPKEQLEVGKTYTAPNGQIMSWTGTGFVPATNGPTKLNLNLRQ